MQKRFFSTEFVVILLFFVLPPIVFVKTPGAEQMAHFSWSTFALAALAGGLLWQIRRGIHGNPRDDTDGRVRLWRVLMDQAAALVTFGALIVVAIVFEVLGRFVLSVPDTVRILPPETALGWTNVILGTVCAAFYEEVLYRLYLPDAIKVVCARKNTPPESTRAKRISFLCEATAIVLFALAHRYAGFLAVLNAFLGGMLLRRCFVRTGALWTNVTAHTAYNFVMLMLVIEK